MQAFFCAGEHLLVQRHEFLQAEVVLGHEPRRRIADIAHVPWLVAPGDADPISEVANLEKKVPLSWMNANHTQMTEEFLDYARPLIQAELTPLYIAGLPHHIYMKNQK